MGILVCEYCGNTRLEQGGQGGGYKCIRSVDGRLTGCGSVSGTIDPKIVSSVRDGVIKHLHRGTCPGDPPTSDTSPPKCLACEVASHDDVTQKTLEIQEETLLHLLMTRKHLREQVASLQGEMSKMQFAERDLELDIKLHEETQHGEKTYRTELPKYQSEGAAGMDLAAREDHVVRHGGKVLIPTGVLIALPRGFVGLVQPRSGLSWKKDQLAVTGMIDSDYRGEIHVQLFNMGQDMYRVKQGDRIAQLIILRRPKIVLETNQQALRDGAWSEWFWINRRRVMSKYATEQKFGGQRVSVGRVVILATERHDLTPDKRGESCIRAGSVRAISSKDMPCITVLDSLNHPAQDLAEDEWTFVETNTEAEVEAMPIGSWTWPPRI